MHELDLSRLQSELLRSGVAPRHVRRTVDELNDHYEDLVEQGLSEGLDSKSAHSGAMTMLGAVEDITQAVRAQPELRSWAFRFPHVAAVVYPLTCVMLLPAAPVFIGAAHANHLARWAVCLFLSGFVTAAMFLMLQMAITLT